METDVLAAHEEIRGAVEYHHAEGLVETGDRWMLGGVLDLSELDVGQVMVQRTSISMIDIARAAFDAIKMGRDLQQLGADFQKLLIEDFLGRQWFVHDSNPSVCQRGNFL